MSARTQTATAMAFRDQLRRPLILILLVLLPAYVISKAIADTRPTPRLIGLPGGGQVLTTMRDLHAPEMAKISVAFAVALVGLFVMQSALEGDRRLVVAGFPAGAAVIARLAVVLAATVLVVAVSVVMTGVFFTPKQWLPVVAALVLTGLIYGAIGALAGALLDKLPATYLILFLAMTDLGVVQTPMFHATPARFGFLLPGYGPTRVMIDGAFSDHFHAAGELMFAIGWTAVLGAAVWLVLRRTLGTRTTALVPYGGISEGANR